MNRLICDEMKFAANGEAGSFSGYGAVFGNVDSYGDVIAPGAFKETLAAVRKSQAFPPMLLQHGGFMGGAEDMTPIGLWTGMEEDDTGLKVEGKICLATQRGAEVYALMKMEPRPAINGLSIGYRAKTFTVGTKPKEPRRLLQAIDLQEVSIVTDPANAKARINDVKAANSIRTIREFEDFLRDSGGFSRATAKAIASSGWKAKTDHRDDDGDGEELAALLKRAAEAIKPIRS